MADIIKGPWDKKPRGSDRASSGERFPSEEQFRQRLAEMHEYLRRLEDDRGNAAATEENIEQRQRGLQGNSIQDLKNIIWNSTWQDWAAHPSFYFAAARTLRTKIKELLESGEGDANRD